MLQHDKPQLNNTTPSSSNWSIDEAKRTYLIPQWSEGYFDVNNKGQLVAYPSKNKKLPSVVITDIIKQLAEQGYGLPVLIRFTDILKQRINDLCDAFNEAIKTANYQGNYTAVYPIKVNQHRQVIENLNPADRQDVGLEAGSKPELLAVMGLASDHHVIVCNGYKDRSYVRLCLMAQQLGHRVLIIIEKFSELALILDEAQQMKLQPELGVRIRLASIGAGKWQNTGGEKSKFGLTATQLLKIIETLKHESKLDWLSVIHFHLGSQIANLRDIHHAMIECARYYAQFHAQGVPITCIDVGGGLGVDYEGSRSRTFCSMNYNLSEYAHTIIHAMKEICQSLQLPHPDIITESGRALTAHHAVLVTNVIDVDIIHEKECSESSMAINTKHQVSLKPLQTLIKQTTTRNAYEIYHDANHFMQDLQQGFNHGSINLSERSAADKLYYTLLDKIRHQLNPQHKQERLVLDEIQEKLTDKYFCNFSLFESTPDIWAIGQIFPIVPLENLNVQPTRRGAIHDITCDSDGRIDYYVDGTGIKTSLLLPEYKPTQPLLLGIFMVGAYQEILGDIHNLFGDTHSVHVNYDEAKQDFVLVEPKQGDSIAALLDYVNIDIHYLTGLYQSKLEKSQLPEKQQQLLLAELTKALQGYTYLDFQQNN